jgi:hypothetical protein
MEPNAFHLFEILDVAMVELIDNKIVALLRSPEDDSTINKESTTHTIRVDGSTASSEPKIIKLRRKRKVKS